MRSLGSRRTGLDTRLCDFVDSELEPDYPDITYEVEVRYGIPRFRYSEENRHGNFEGELFSLGTAMCEITEWAVPHGPYTEVMDVHWRVKGVSGRMWPRGIPLQVLLGGVGSSVWLREGD